MPYFKIYIIVFITFVYVSIIHSEDLNENIPYDFYGFNEAYYSCQDLKIDLHRSRATIYYILEPRKCKFNTKHNLVVFIPGWPDMIPDVYYFWLEHLVKRGNMVLFATYLPFRNSQRYSDIVYSEVIQALNILKNKNVDFEHIAITGHSSGGDIALNVASKMSLNNLPKVKAIMPVEPGNGSYIKEHHLIPLATGFELENLNYLDDNTLMLIVLGSSSTENFLTNATNIYNLTENIPNVNKNIIMFNTVKNGTFELRANHFFPTSWGLIPGIGIGENDLPLFFDFIDFIDADFNLFRVDIFDYKLWYLFDSLMDAAFYNTNGNDVLNGTDKQRYIGNWPDGTEIEKLSVIK